MSNSGFQGDDSETLLPKADRSIKVGEDINSSNVISGDGSVGVQGDRATITITNYYYREDTKLVSVESTDIAGDENLPCPYRGLFHFGPDDGELFFGRELLVEELVEATQNRRFIPVLAAIPNSNFDNGYSLA